MREYRIPTLAQKYVNYDMIYTYTELPPLSDPRLRLLCAVLNESSDYADKSELFALVTSLVQLGMDTHDQIDSESAGQNELEMRSTQLKVLAGDYFSTRFYQLLAQQGQISMIASLSASVCDVNRLKMDFYTKFKQYNLTDDEYFNYRVQIKSHMFMLYGDWLSGAAARLWPELLLSISRCETIVEEIKMANNTQQVMNSWAYWHLLQEDSMNPQHKLLPEQIIALIGQHPIMQQLKQRLDEALLSAQAVIRKLSSEHLEEILIELAESLRLQSVQFFPALNQTR